MTFTTATKEIPNSASSDLAFTNVDTYVHVPPHKQLWEVLPWITNLVYHHSPIKFSPTTTAYFVAFNNNALKMDFEKIPTTEM